MTTQLANEPRTLVENLDWREYRELADSLGESKYRLAYDRGSLEIMTLSLRHERISKILGQFVEVLTDEFDLPRQSAGSTTLNREDQDRGVEPDQCYYLDHEPQVRDKDEIDLAVDPPPDLAIEVDISRSSLNRMGIYAAISVPEIWRYDGTNLLIYQRTEEGTYREVPRSRFFPLVSPQKLEEFLTQRTTLDETRLVRGFRQWVRQQLVK